MKIEKAYAITNARISFVSLVNKAANKRRFLITKADEDKARFTSCGRIVKADSENHYVTGIVYEPMTEDTDGNYMTEDEITKAAYWYNRNGDKVDIQHSFQPTDGAAVVESWIAKADFDIDGQHIKKGSWLMTMEVTNGDIWDEIQKGTITGFSMGGVGEYSGVNEVIKGCAKSDNTEAKSLFAKLGKALGLSVVEKGRVTDEYRRQAKDSAFWAAFDSLRVALTLGYSSSYESDESRIRSALQEFNDIVVELLNSPEPVSKTIKPREEAVAENNNGADTCEAETETGTDKGKKTKKQEISPEQDEPKEDEEDKEEPTLTKAEIEQIATAVAKAINHETSEEVAKAAESEEDTDVTEDAVKQMVEQAVAKAMKPEKPDVPTADIQTMIDTAVEKAVSAVMKSRNNPSNLNGNFAGKPESAEHYMHGIL